jgi:hypothetical protein
LMRKACLDPLRQRVRATTANAAAWSQSQIMFAKYRKACREPPAGS